MIAFATSTSANTSFFAVWLMDYYWQYELFDLDDLRDDECKAEFRFMKNDIYRL